MKREIREKDEEGGRRGDEGGIRKSSTKIDPFQRTSCMPYVGFVAHVTHVGDAAEIPRGALAMHLHKIYL